MAEVRRECHRFFCVFVESRHCSSIHFITRVHGCGEVVLVSCVRHESAHVDEIIDPAFNIHDSWEVWRETPFVVHNKFESVLPFDQVVDVGPVIS